MKLARYTIGYLELVPLSDNGGMEYQMSFPVDIISLAKTERQMIPVGSLPTIAVETLEEAENLLKEIPLSRRKDLKILMYTINSVPYGENN